MPRRIRGIILGLVILVTGPVVGVVAAGGKTAPVAVHKSTAPAYSTAILTGRVGYFHAHEIGYSPGPTPHAAAPAIAIRAVKPTPSPKPASGPVPGVSYAPGTVAAIIMAAAAQYGVDGNWMVRIASCESGLRPNAYNPGGPYIGLFQFLPSTFAAHGGTNIYDPTQQATIAANMIAHGGARAWPVCSQR
jgi:hypothetical protein